ncbi:hypothetical protein AAC387_Pa09g0387 [Persea americana]
MAGPSNMTWPPPDRTARTVPTWTGHVPSPPRCETPLAEQTKRTIKRPTARYSSVLLRVERVRYEVEVRTHRISYKEQSRRRKQRKSVIRDTCTVD